MFQSAVFFTCLFLCYVASLKHPDEVESLPGTPVINRIGRLVKLKESSSNIVVSWTIKDFFNLPYSRNKGVLSEDFDIPGGTAFIALHPDGDEYNNEDDFIRFMVVFMCPVNEGMRKSPEIDCEVTLKTDEGTFYKSLASKDSKYLGSDGGYFLHYFELSEITTRKDSLVPGGVLTAKIELKTQKNKNHPPKYEKPRNRL